MYLFQSRGCLRLNFQDITYPLDNVSHQMKWQHKSTNLKQNASDYRVDDETENSIWIWPDLSCFITLDGSLTEMLLDGWLFHSRKDGNWLTGGKKKIF